MARVVFSLTDRQADALAALHRGEPLPIPAGRSQTLLLNALHTRGLLDGKTLTPLGSAAASLAVVLATASYTSNGRCVADRHDIDVKAHSTVDTPHNP